jgi:hypothetical protein
VEANLEGYLVLSMTHNETKVLRWSSSTPRINGVPWSGVIDMSITDCTALVSSSYQFSEGTLAIALTDRGLVQVTPSGIYLGDGLTHHLTPDERIVQAAITDDYITIVKYSQSKCCWALIDFTIRLDSLDSSSPLILPREPTTIKSIIHRSSNESPATFARHTFLSYRQPPEIQIFSFSPPNPPTLVSTLPVDHIDRSSDIHSLEILYTRPTIGHLLIGTRQGIVLAYRMLSSPQRFDFPECNVMSVGTGPVEFIPVAFPGRGKENSVFAMSGSLWEICVEREWPQGLTVQEVLFDDFRIVLFSS